MHTSTPTIVLYCRVLTDLRPARVIREVQSEAGQEFLCGDIDSMHVILSTLIQSIRKFHGEGDARDEAV